MTVYRSSTYQHQDHLIQLIYDNRELSFYAIVYDLNGRRLFTSDKLMQEELANNQALRWVRENNL